MYASRTNSHSFTHVSMNHYISAKLFAIKLLAPFNLSHRKHILLAQKHYIWFQIEKPFVLVSMVYIQIFQRFNPLTAGAAYISFLLAY